MPRVDSPPSGAAMQPTAVAAVTNPNAGSGVTAVSGAEGPISARSWSGPPPPMEEQDELVGTTLCNTYVIKRVLGEGGMGRVYEAHHTRIAAKRFAIKTLHPEYLRQRDVIQRFQREAEASASISSPNVVGVYDIDRTDDGRPFLVAELLEGQELGDRLDQSGKLEMGQAVGIVRQVCQALAAAHERGIVHRDVKPENVFLTGEPADPLVKVLDFGISRLDDDSGKQLTRTGMVMGTPAYMPPEQARGERVDHRADIYAAGAILYTALTGQVPFERDDPAATLVAVLTQEPERPRALEPSIPEPLEFIIQKAMARDPADRYQSARAFGKALAAFDPHEQARALGATGTPAIGTARTEVSGARALLVVMIALGLLGAVLGLITAVAGVMRLAGAALSSTETVLLLLGGAAGLITPLVLVGRHVRAVAWNNSLKTLAMLGQVRGPLVAAGCTYGLGALSVRLADGVLVPDSLGAGWAGWDVVLFALAAASGAAATVMDRRGRHGSASGGGARSGSLGFVIGTGVVVVVAIMAAMSWRGPGDEPRADSTVGGQPLAEAVGHAPRPGAGRDRATTEELEIARDNGLEALGALAGRYPADPAVAKELMVAQSLAPGGMKDALGTLEKLVETSEPARYDPDVRRTLRRAASKGGALADRAFALMADKMGSAGPDLLYELSGDKPSLRKRCNALLAKPEVRERSSAALRIAVDLGAAKGCQAKHGLLDRVSADGDQRCVKLLQPLTVGSKHGCGFLGLKGCPPRCRAYAADMRRAVAAVRARSKAGGR